MGRLSPRLPDVRIEGLASAEHHVVSAHAPRHQASPTHPLRMLPNAPALGSRAGWGDPVMLLPAVETLRTSRHSVWFD
jgi:hypothetical protein